MSEQYGNTLNADSIRPPDWLPEALASVADYDEYFGPEAERPEAPSAFRERCRQSAVCALALARMRDECHRTGFVPLSVADYFDGIAKSAGVGLDPVLEQYGLPSLRQLDSQSASALGRLARAVGMRLEVVLANLRIALAEALGVPPVAILAARGRAVPGRHTSPLEECEAALSRVEANYSAAEKHQLSQIELAARAAYDTPEATPFA